LKFFHRKSRAIKKWRSRAWCIDPKVTNLTIIKTEAEKTMESLDTADSNLDFNLNFFKLLKDYPQYFDALADMEQFS
jgi:hypothetical protein